MHDRRFLIDTHCWLWLQAEPGRFSAGMLQNLADPESERYLSAASAWEIAIKHALGKLPLPQAPAVYVPDRMRVSGVVALPVTQAHALAVSELPLHHRDPFDRMLVAQAQHEGLTLVTADSAFAAYQMRTVHPGDT